MFRASPAHPLAAARALLRDSLIALCAVIALACAYALLH